MEVAVCPHCTTRYHVPDHAAGKRTRCKKCGRAFRIPSAEPPVAAPDPQSVEAADPFSGLDLALLARGTAVDVPRVANGLAAIDSGGGGVALAERPMAYAAVEPAQRMRPGAGAYGHYLAEIGRSLLFFTKPGNLIVFLVLWFLIVVRSFLVTAFFLAPCFTLIWIVLALVVITGWYWAYKMKLVVWSAGGESEFPSLSLDEGWADGIFLPFLRMLATYVFAILPAGLFGFMLLERMGAAVAAQPGASGAPMPTDGVFVAFLVLWAVGLFFWPMMVLVVSCGNSIGALFRLDLITETIFRSLPAYALTVVAVYLTFGIEGLVSSLVLTHAGGSKGLRSDLSSQLLIPALLRGIGLYFELVAMRAIGAYYCHFKHRFAWSWG